MTLSQLSKKRLNHHSDGFLLINKPEGISSFGVVRQVRHISSIQKVGHAGTLDPFASGLLVLALGKAYTTQIRSIQVQNKMYQALMVLGIETDTLDSKGKVTQIKDVPPFTQSLLDHIAQTFIGEMSQDPPIFSAKKVKGRRAYQLARAGKTIVLEPKVVTISHLTLSLVQQRPNPIISLEVTCSTGTYIRALVRDIAKALGTVGYTKSLVRTCIGTLSLEKAVSMSDLTLPVIQNALIQ
jgi:tRNA pseudouridine55 synthase